MLHHWSEAEMRDFVRATAEIVGLDMRTTSLLDLLQTVDEMVSIAATGELPETWRTTE